MSRIGKLPVSIPSGVQVTLNGKNVAVKGPKGALSLEIGSGVSVSQEGSHVLVTVTGTDKQAKANYGTTRVKIDNMIKGVTQGWARSLELSGVGYTAKMEGNVLTLAVGYSHEVKIVIPKGLNCNVNKTSVALDSCDKELVGGMAAKIRKVCPPEPYLGKGIKYSDERVRRKAGKTGKK